MDVNLEELQKRYEEFSDEQLIDINIEDLIDEVRELFLEELRKRGISEKAQSDIRILQITKRKAIRKEETRNKVINTLKRIVRVTILFFIGLLSMFSAKEATKITPHTLPLTLMLFVVCVLWFLSSRRKKKKSTDNSVK